MNMQGFSFMLSRSKHEPFDQAQARPVEGHPSNCSATCETISNNAQPDRPTVPLA